MVLSTAIVNRLSAPIKHWFWKTQIGVLRACPPLLGVVSKVSLNAYKSRRLWLQTITRTAGQVPRALRLHRRDKQAGRIVLPRISIVVTTRCTNNRDKCALHIPDLKCHADLHKDTLLRDIQRLFACVDEIYDVNLTGGEAFLHPDLHEIIRAFARPGKVSAIDITTNGTVIPNEMVLMALKEANVTVKVTKYPEALQPDVEKLKSVLQKNGINYMHDSGSYWNDTGAFGQLQDGSGKQRFSVCVQQLCLVYFKGKLHLCAQSAAMVDEGLIGDCKEDYIDLRELPPAAFRQQLRRLQKKRDISACAYCLGHTYTSPRVSVGEQRGAKS